MTYIVTTTDRKGIGAGGVKLYDTQRIASRRAVATLDEARDEAHRKVNGVAGGQAARNQAKAIPESGGTVGPLPDGTMIEVKPFNTAAWYSDHAPLPRMTDAEIIAAYNEAQADG